MMHTIVSKNSSKGENIDIGQYLKPSLYETPPTEDVPLEKFEFLSVYRHKLLRDIDRLKARGYEDKELYSHILKSEHKSFHEALVNWIDFDSIDYSDCKSDKEKIRRKKEIAIKKEKIEGDRVSHFILRLGFCRTEDLRKWFLAQELWLFKARLDYLDNDKRTQFMEEHGFKFDPVSKEDKRAKKHKLMGLAGTNEKNFESTEFYKVPFLQALQLIGPRQVYLERGMAYIPITRLLHIITARFRQNLSQALTEASQIFEKVVSGDGRIASIFKNMDKQYLGEDFASRQVGMQQADKLSSPEQVEEAAKTHFPLCMRNLHQGLQKEHKLKHWGRLQYTLFLKGCGLDLDGAVNLMQMHFTKVMSTDQFVKTYAYSFRHMFGKEGARRNYTPYSCMKIINGSPPETGAYHGCVFKHSPDHVLISLLNQEKLSPEQIRDIVATAKSNNHSAAVAAAAAASGIMTYQLACQKHFDITHPDHLTLLQNSDVRSEAVAIHPNQWFQASVQYHRMKNGGNNAQNAVKSSTESYSSSTANATNDSEYVMQVDDAEQSTSV